MDLTNQSYWQIGVFAKTKRKIITKLKDEILALEKKLELTFANTRKHRLDLVDSISVLNQIASKKFQIRYEEEELFQCEKRRKLLTKDLYKLHLVIDSFSGKIKFTCKTKGEKPEVPFTFDGNKVEKNDLIELKEMSWVKHGNMAIQKSFVRLFDQTYALVETGDFICFPTGRKIEEYEPEDVIENILSQTV